MKGFYNLSTTIKDALKEDAFCNTVVFGGVSEVDLNKQSIFPLSNFIFTNATLIGNIWTFTVELSCADIVDYSKEDTVDIFAGNDNEQDVLNTQLAVIGRLMERLTRGDLYNDFYQLEGNPSMLPFKGKLDNMLAGWTVTFNVNIKNEMTIC
jgi:hypothetical protein